MPAKNKSFFLCLAIFLLWATPSGFAQTPHENPPKIRNIYVGMNKKLFAKFYPKARARTYRQKDNEEWLTFNHPLKTQNKDVVTFHVQNNKISGWQINNRQEVINEYLSEFSSVTFKTAFPVINEAIRDVLTRMPFEDFLKITDRRRPVLFTEFFDSGTAQFANSSEIISLPDDAPAFQDGLTIIKLSTALASKENKAAIRGVIAHEIAHRALEHVKNSKRTCAAEREANALIKQWGFVDEYTQASQAFGQKAVGEVIHCPQE